MIVRPTARLIVLDNAGRVLLFQFDDPRVVEPGEQRKSPPHRLFWCTPGGGVEAGESFEDAARRELLEETGINDVELGPCVLTREKPLTVSGKAILFQERYFSVRVAPSTISLDGLAELERDVYRAHRWWSLDELDATSEAVFPEGLADVIRSNL